MSNIVASQNSVKRGSWLLNREDKKFNPIDYSVEHMSENKAFKYALLDNENRYEEVLQHFKDRYLDYRKKWTDQPENCFKENIDNKNLIENGIIPLCLDLETAAICDLACPFCYREYMATPDKTINLDFAEKLIKEAGEIGIPSIKFNWRGEPLLFPKLPYLIDLAKKNGVLETMINTNATQLNEKKSKELIESGLDVMIYSVDGGTKETYEKMRPGRFKENKFENVYRNIYEFKNIRESLNKKFPRTKIQMILNEDTFNEQEEFFKLFGECVDEVSVNTYTERGGSLSELTEKELQKYYKFCDSLGLPKDSPYMKDSMGKMWISESRKPCQQIYQRLMVTYDGRAGMCCYDWGSTHPVGFLSNESFDDPDKPYREIMGKVEKKHQGFELLQAVEIPPTHNFPEKEVSTIKDLWEGDELNKVREFHKKRKLEKVGICEKCTYKDTYNWKEI